MAARPSCFENPKEILWRSESYRWRLQQLCSCPCRLQPQPSALVAESPPVATVATAVNSRRQNGRPPTGGLSHVRKLYPKWDALAGLALPSRRGAQPLEEQCCGRGTDPSLPHPTDEDLSVGTPALRMTRLGRVVNPWSQGRDQGCLARVLWCYICDPLWSWVDCLTLAVLLDSAFRCCEE